MPFSRRAALIAGLALGLLSTAVAAAPNDGASWTFGHIVGLPQAVLAPSGFESVDDVQLMITCVARRTLLFEVRSVAATRQGPATLSGDSVSIRSDFGPHPDPQSRLLRAAFEIPPAVSAPLLQARRLRLGLAMAGETQIDTSDAAVRHVMQDCLG